MYGALALALAVALLAYYWSTSTGNNLLATDSVCSGAGGSEEHYKAEIVSLKSELAAQKVLLEMILEKAQG